MEARILPIRNEGQKRPLCLEAPQGPVCFHPCLSFMSISLLLSHQFPFNVNMRNTPIIFRTHVYWIMNQSLYSCMSGFKYNSSFNINTIVVDVIPLTGQQWYKFTFLINARTGLHTHLSPHHHHMLQLSCTNENMNRFILGLLRWLSGKEPVCQCRSYRDTRIWSLHHKNPLKKEMATPPLFLPGKSQGQRSLAGCSPWGHKKSDTTEHLSTHTC